jgi:hypothetical protein
MTFDSDSPDRVFVMPPGVLILIKAGLLARSSGAAEIGIDELLSAINIQSPLSGPTASSEGPFIPVPKYDILLSSAAAKAIASAGNLETLSSEQLRNALLNARGSA